MAVVAQDALDPDAVLSAEPGHRPLQEGNRGLGALAGQHLAVGKPGVVVDCHVQVLHAGARASVDAVGQDALSHLVKAAQGLGVHVQELAGALARRAHGLGTGGWRQPRGAGAPKHLADG
jgi:hypothetical protein